MTEPAEWENLNDDELLTAAEALIDGTGGDPRLSALIEAVLSGGRADDGSGDSPGSPGSPGEPGGH